MRLKLSLLLVFMITYSWSQSGSTKTFTGNGTFIVPAGVTSLAVQAWGGGGSGGGASGAPLLLGRGAAGRGGGAYASNTIAVTPGATLNVVVASQTAGTTGAGTAGGSSTITGFESSILAAGGSGGDANSAGGSPVGGAGGTTAASAGSVKFAGANGGNGNSWNLLGILLSSGAGGAGANFGGAGGTAVSGIIFSNAPGNAGSPPGGAGSGGINSALGVSQIGGAGAAGQVIISYTCANFSLTSTAAANVCAATGTTSAVTVTGNTASLPVGDYVVTYNRSSPSATALTANLTVSTAGTGTFTAVGLTTAGSSTITITKLESASCSSTITANNTATVTVSPATVGGTVTGGTTITSGSTSGLLTLSGHTGAVIKWQSSVSPFTTWTDIANTATTYTSGVLTVTTQFRAVVQSGVCSVENAAPTTVTVNDPPPTIALDASAGNVCRDIFNSDVIDTLLAYTGTTGDPVTYSIVWDSGAFIPVTDQALPASPITISVPSGIGGGIYTATLTVKNASGVVSNPGSVFSLNLGYLPLIVTSGIIDEVETSTSSQNASLPFDGTIANPISYSIDWDAAANAALLTDQPSTTFTWSSFGGIIDTIVIPANVPAGTYSGTITSFSETCSSSKPVSITINPAEELPTITLDASTANVCADGEAQTRSLAYSATTGDPISYSIVWDSSPANSFVPVTDAALPANSITIEIPAGADAGTYTGTLTVKDANGAVSNPGSVFTVTLDDYPSITSTGTIDAITTSTSAQNATLAYTDAINNPTSYSIDWDTALLADQGDTPFAFSSWGGTVDNIVIPANVPAGTYMGTMLIKNGSCPGIIDVSITINPAELPTIALAFKTDDICLDGSNNEQYTPLSFKGTTGDPVSYSIVWDSSPVNNLVAVTNAPLPASPILIAVPGNTNAGIYTGTLTVKDANGVSSLGTTFTLNVGVTPIITIYGTIDPVTTSTNAQNTTLEYSGITGNPTSYYIDWDQTANDALLEDQPNTLYEFLGIGDLIETIEISANAQPGTYSGIMYFTDGSCTGSHPVSVVINEAQSAKATLPKDNEITGLGKNAISVGVDNKAITVEAPNQIIKEVFVFDVSGNLRYKKNKVSDSKLVITDLRSSNQVLVVKVVLNNNHSEIRKVIH